MDKTILKLKSGTDIRGVALEGEPNQPVQLTDDVVYGITRAFGALLKSGCRKNAAAVRLP